MKDDKDYGWRLFGIFVIALLGLPLTVLIVYTIKHWLGV